MSENLSINQVEKRTGVSKRNIRFYEKEGLLLPKRNSENGYRIYDESDIWRIKVIKMLRMLDMPLEEIQKVLEEDRPLSEAIVNQQVELECKAKELQAAIHFCEQMKEVELDTLDVDRCLNDIENDNCEGFFKLWVDDYKSVVEENRNMDFSFMPDTRVVNAREFTDALFAYANQENLNLVITKESMTPEFTIDGVEYTAMRHYMGRGPIPPAVIVCMRKDRAIKGEAVPEKRKIVQWLLHKYSWQLGIVAFLGIISIFIDGGISFEIGVICFGLLALIGAMAYKDIVLHFNDKTK